MTVESIREALRDGAPFSVETAAGEIYEIPHPDFAALNKTGRLLSIWVSDSKQVTLDVALLLGIETDNRLSVAE